MMDFLDLQAVYNHLKDCVQCPQCGAHFNMKHVEILATLDAHGLAEASCRKCKTNVMISFSVKKIDLTAAISGGHKNVDVANKIIDVEIKNTKKISTNDVIDMHNFVKNFQGDLKDLLF